MKSASKKRSWLKFINQSRENYVKNEILNPSTNEISLRQLNHNYHHHPIINSSHINNSNYRQSSIQISLFERSNNINHTQEINDLEHGKNNIFCLFLNIHSDRTNELDLSSMNKISFVLFFHVFYIYTVFVYITTISLS